MRLPASADTSRRWRIHGATHDFRLEDVWALPVSGPWEDFPRLPQLLASYDPLRSSSGVVRALFGMRKKLGELLHLDRGETGVGARVATLRDRLPADLLDGERGPDFDAIPVTSLYLTRDEWAGEAANATVHGVIHIGALPDESGGFRAQMAIYVKPNGPLGALYMAAIKPFRYAMVYPALLREVGSLWRARDASGDRSRRTL